MNTQITPSWNSLNYRSNSMPTIRQHNASHDLLNYKFIKKDQISNMQAKKVTVELDQIINQQEQEIHSKLKLIAQRSLQKLNRKYQTIDKWKEKYMPSCYDLWGKQKFRLVERGSVSHQFNDHSGIEVKKEQELMLPSLKHNLNLPLVLVQHNDRGKILKVELKERINRDKRYHDARRDSQSQQSSNLLKKNVIEANRINLAEHKIIQVKLLISSPTEHQLLSCRNEKPIRQKQQQPHKLQPIKPIKSEQPDKPIPKSQSQSQKVQQYKQKLLSQLNIQAWQINSQLQTIQETL